MTPYGKCGRFDAMLDLDLAVVNCWPKMEVSYVSDCNTRTHSREAA
jgi:hypothetical protein